LKGDDVSNWKGKEVQWVSETRNILFGRDLVEERAGRGKVRGFEIGKKIMGGDK